MITPSVGKIVEEYSEAGNRVGIVEFDGKRRAVYLNLVPGAHVGDCIRFHAGFATERVIITGDEAGCGEAAQAGPAAEPSDLTLLSGHAYRLLRDLDPDQLIALLPIAQEQRFAPGQIIFQSGDQSSFLHLIVTGEVALEEMEGPSPIAVQNLHAGDAMGWSALTAGARTHFQARALSDTSTVAFPGDQLRAACEKDPALGYNLMKRLVELVSERLDAMRLKLAARGESPVLQSRTAV